MFLVSAIGYGVLLFLLYLLSFFPKVSTIDGKSKVGINTNSVWVEILVSASNTNETCKLCDESVTDLLSSWLPILIILLINLNPWFTANTVILVPSGYCKLSVLSSIISSVSLINNLTERSIPELAKAIAAVSIVTTTSLDSFTNSNSVVNWFPFVFVFEVKIESSTPFTNFFIETTNGKTFVNTGCGERLTKPILPLISNNPSLLYPFIELDGSNILSVLSNLKSGLLIILTLYSSLDE